MTTDLVYEPGCNLFVKPPPALLYSLHITQLMWEVRFIKAVLVKGTL